MGGCGRAQVGGQIRQGHIHLMADTRQYGQPGVKNSFGHGLLIEGPEIFQ